MFRFKGIFELVNGIGDEAIVFKTVFDSRELKWVGRTEDSGSLGEVAVIGVVETVVYETGTLLVKSQSSTRRPYSLATIFTRRGGALTRRRVAGVAHGYACTCGGCSSRSEYR
jgi:hypothetical protein